ncbi:MAG: cytochrome c3 family protein [Kiritimatiellales bacterium]|nr:cytochrome c3 family protein [Kiritimatiellales bacterium]MCF7864538.1 cytochrome c3 family protein [Kiritimatiellales bacterium]
MKTQQLILPILGMALTAFSSHYDGSRTLPVHRIPLTDEEGQKIVSTVPGSMPFSAQTTCGACHDYETIHGGTHFAGTGQGRPTEPWIVVDEQTGTQVPANRMNLSAWEFTKQFGSHLPGGSISDPADKLADPDARWDISGGLEINCLSCHNHSPRQDMTEWAKQIGRENFRWAATAASGMGEVGGMCARLPDWWNVHSGENPDDHVYAVPPSVNYDAAQFDSKHRAWFDIGKPQDKNCLYCHSAYPVGVERIDVPGDVHAAAGLACVDCHRNGLDHQILRGTSEAMSCSSCHIENGQLGAPIAQHKGLPPIHFEKLTCTACHSGLKPGGEPSLMRTSRANRLGIYGRAQWFTESPFIVEPVFVRNDEGQIEPRRMMWPAFWAYADGIPLDADLVQQAALGVLDADRQVGDILAKLAGAENAPGEPLFAVDGKLYRRNIDGGLDRAGSMRTGDSWVWSTETNIVSTIPEFDVDAAEINYDAEGAIAAVMEALKPLDIVLVTKGKLFAKNADGYLAGTNTTLESGWYTKDGAPLVAAFVERAVADTVGTTMAFNEEQVALMLKKLGDTTCYISNGRKFSLDAGGTLIDEDDEAAAPVSWPIAHDVRGAAQSLGATTCKECHSPDSGFLFGHVTATGPLLTERAQVVPMYGFEGLESGYNKLFGQTFKVRKSFKTVLGILAFILGLIVLAFGLLALRQLAERVGKNGSAAKTALVAMIVSLVVLSVTGFGFGWPFSYPLNGFALLSHVGFGALYAVALTVWVLLRAKAGGTVWFWLLAVCGIVLILSVLLAMFPIFGTHGQHVCIQIHRIAAIASVVAAMMGCIRAQRK